MDKPKVTGRIQEFHGRKFLQNGAEVITLIISHTFENGKFKVELTTPISFYGGIPKCLEKFDALNLGVGDLVEVPYLPAGYKSKSGDFWNAKLDGDTFGLKVLEKAIEFGEKPAGDF